MANNVSLLGFFKAEHAIISKTFGHELPLAQSTNNWGPLFLFCKNTIEDNHHEKEEQFIFEAIKNIPNIRTGGPLCTYFFDFHMNDPTLRRATEIIKNQTGLSFEPNWSIRMQEIRERNLPLVIPGEDHEAGRVILRAIEHLINSGTDSRFKINELFRVYLEIQKAHFDREENCFFKMCMNLIPPEEWNQIHNKMGLHYKEICNSD